jgi:hypothetical protein
VVLIDAGFDENGKQITNALHGRRAAARRAVRRVHDDQALLEPPAFRRQAAPGKSGSAKTLRPTIAAADALQGHVLTLFLLAACSIDEPVPATTSSAAKTPVTTPAPAVAERVLILEPTSMSVNAETLATIASLLSVEIGKMGTFEVVSAGELKKMADLEGEKAAVGCESTSCLADLAGALGARLIVFGDAATLGTLIVVNLSLFDASTGRSVNRVSMRVSSVEKLPDELTVAVTELFPRAAPTAATAATPQGTPAWWTVTLLGGGAAVALAGLAFDVFAPSSRNGRRDIVDVLGPVAYVIGGGSIVVGAFVNPFAEATDVP